MGYQGFGKLLLISIAAALAACEPAGVFTAGAGTLRAASQERGVSGAFSDTSIKARIHFVWFEKDPFLNKDLNVNVHEGRVLITGHVSTPALHVEMLRLTWTVQGVKEVIDESRIGKDEGGLGEGVSDTWLATQVRSGLLFSTKISSQNYTVEVLHGIVYLLGVAQDQAELDLVLKEIRETDGVAKVVSYVRVLTPQERARKGPKGESNLARKKRLNLERNLEAPGELTAENNTNPPTTSGMDE